MKEYFQASNKAIQNIASFLISQNQDDQTHGYFLKQDAILLYSVSSEIVSTNVESFREVAGRAVFGLENRGVTCHTKPSLLSGRLSHCRAL